MTRHSDVPAGVISRACREHFPALPCSRIPCGWTVGNPEGQEYNARLGGRDWTSLTPTEVMETRAALNQFTATAFVRLLPAYLCVIEVDPEVGWEVLDGIMSSFDPQPTKVQYSSLVAPLPPLPGIKKLTVAQLSCIALYFQTLGDISAEDNSDPEFIGDLRRLAEYWRVRSRPRSPE